MILSSQTRPFSRQAKSNHSWSNGHSMSPAPPSSNGFHYATQPRRQPQGLPATDRKPAPKQPAPDRPNGLPVNSGFVHNANGYRSLNRLDIVRRRQQQQQQQQQPRNLSSLGHHPSSISATTNGKPQPPIYAPASISSPRELARFKTIDRPHLQTPTNGLHQPESQHYAATSFRGPASESGRSGRESALGQLLDKFDTLRRRAKWSRSTQRSRMSTSVNSVHNTKSSGTPNGIYSTPKTPLGDPEQPIYDSTKKHLEADEIYAEGSRAIDSNGLRRSLEQELDAQVMLEGETRLVIEQSSRNQVEFRQLSGNLMNWINDELAEQRIIVRDLQDDLFDGQVLCKLIEKLQQIKLDIVEVTQNEETQKFKLKTVLDTINRILVLQARWARIRWSVDGIHGKNLVEIIHLLVALALYYRAPIKLPANLQVNVQLVQKQHDQLIRRTHQVQLTDSLVSKLDLDTPKQPSSTLRLPNNQDLQQRDAFDTLLEFAPEKLHIVQQALVKFVNRHLNKVNMSCTTSMGGGVANEFSKFQHQTNYSSTMSTKEHLTLDPEQFSDGLLLVFLISSLEDYFVPLGNLFTTSNDHRPSTLSTLNHDKLPFIDGNNNDIYADNTANDSNLDDTYASCQLLQTALEPTSFINTQPIEKLHNINVALKLIEEAGIDIKQRVRAEDIANGDLKAVLRVLYALFSRYKHI